MALRILDLNLSLGTRSPPPPQPATAAPPSCNATAAPSCNATAAPPSRKRRCSNQPPDREKSVEITPPYPWATNRRAMVLSLQRLQSMGINSISGRVQCKRCERQFEMEYDLETKFAEVATFILQNKDEMRHRAPPVWTNPTLPDCRFCEQTNCVKPIFTKKKSINWLFLFLGQMVGCCKLSELKYFCKYTRKHRTGAKDRVLYLTYLELFKQLHPHASYDN